MSVVVTGAAGGIGRACVDAFRARGHHVVGVDATAGAGADVDLVIDLGSPRCGDQLVEALDGREIEVLVNNAARGGDQTVVDTAADDFDRIMAVNLRAPFLLSRALYPSLRDKRGSVVNVASVHAMATSPGVAAYAASKGGLVSLTRALAVEWAPEVRVNCVLPGAVQTAMLEEGVERMGMTLAELGSRHPLGRVGQPPEIAEAVIFLALSSFATGTSLVVDGGATARLSTE